MNQVNELERRAGDMAAEDAQLRLMVAEWRKPMYQDPETWAWAKNMLPAALFGMVAQSGPQVSQDGIQQIVRIIAPSRNGAEAAALLERAWEQNKQRRRLPAVLERELIAILAGGTTTMGIMQAVDGALQRHRYQMSQEAYGHMWREVDRAVKGS